jgi:hypothetical protein
MSTTKSPAKKVMRPKPAKAQSAAQAQAEIIKKYGPTFAKLSK